MCPYGFPSGLCFGTLFLMIERALLVFLSISLVCIPVGHAQDEIFRRDHIFTPVEGRQGAIAAEESTAARVGLEVLQRGGNAVDAAVAVGFTLAVTYPRAGNLGGGGFMLIHDAKAGQTITLDYREVAPAAATRDMFLDEAGNADPRLSRKSPLAVGVPGSVAGLLEAHRRFGTLPLPDLMEPAIRLARDGFPLQQGFIADLKKALEIGRLDKTAQGVFLGPDGTLPEPGDVLRQPELAASLERIREKGRNGFYTGETARGIVETVQAAGGILSLEDLAAYQPVWREAVRGNYRGYTILSMPPPSSGGIHLIQMLNLLENFPLGTWGQNSAQATHIMAEVMKRAYADRSQYLGDPDFADVPQEALLSEAYEQTILPRISSVMPTASSEIAPGPVNSVKEGDNTTHFSIVDRFGNAVANTTTLNFSFGTGIMADGTGILLNNEMDDFTAKVGVPNAYGLIGGDANAIEPGKRMLSSMSPTIVLKDGEVRLVTGSPGGSRIITTVLQVVVNVIDFQLNPAEANAFPRFHHQWLPDVLKVERGFPSDTVRVLEAMGYTVEISKVLGSAQTIQREADGNLTAASDPRRDKGTALAY